MFGRWKSSRQKREVSKDFIDQKARRKTMYKKSESDISVCYAINRADIRKSCRWYTVCVPTTTSPYIHPVMQKKRSWTSVHLIGAGVVTVFKCKEVFKLCQNLRMRPRVFKTNTCIWLDSQTSSLAQNHMRVKFCC